MKTKLVTLLLTLCVILPAVAGIPDDTLSLYYRRNLDHYYNSRQVDEFQSMLGPALEYFKANEEWVYYFTFRVRMAETYVFSKRTEDAMAEADEILRTAESMNNDYGRASALKVMGLSYGYLMNNPEKSAEVLGQAIDLLKKYDEANHIHLRTQIYQNLIQTLLNIVRPQSNDVKLQTIEPVLKEYHRAVDRLEELDPTTPGKNKYRSTNLYTYYVALYNQVGRYDEASHYLSLMEPAADRFLSRQQFIRLKVENLRGRKQYNEALALVDTLMQMYTGTPGNERSIQNMLSIRAQINAEAGYFEQAFLDSREVNARNDSLNVIEMNARLDELRTRYEIDRHVTEKKRNRNYALLFSGAFVLTLAFLAVWIGHSRRLARKNRSLIERIREQDRLREQLNACATQRKALAPEAEQDELFERITYLVEKQQAYTDPSLNRTSLAVLTGSNETYIRQSIQRNTGLTVNAYLTGLRLRHARQMLVDTSLTIEMVAIDSGFKSRSTFHSLFRKEYGLTPDEFRKFS